MWAGECRPEPLQQLDFRADLHLFVLGQGVPPGLKVWGEFHVPCHAWNITYMEYQVKSYPLWRET